MQRPVFWQLVLRLFYLLVVISICLSFPLGVFAQQASATRIRIAKIDSHDFPDVKILAILRDSNNNPMPAGDVAHLKLLENDVAVEFEHQQVTGNLETIFVLDLGQRLQFSEDPPAVRLRDMKIIVRRYLSTMQSGDTTGIVLVTPEGANFIQPLTSDKVQLTQRLDQIDIGNIQGRSRALEGVDDAITVLSQSSARGVVLQDVVLLSSGIQDGEENTATVAQRAKDMDVTVHSLQVRQGVHMAQLSELALTTEGMDVDFQNGGMDVFSLWMNDQRLQYQLSFRSILGDSSDRTLELRSSSSGLGFASDKEIYQVSILPPIVILDTPVNDEEFVRQATSFDQDPAQIEPSSLIVKAHIKWPDGYPRDVSEAQFWVDSSKSGAPVPDPGTNVSFSLDLRSYRSPGTNPVRLQVQVRDELGFDGISEPVNANITVIIPPPPPQPSPSESICEGLQGVDLFRCRLVESIKEIFTTPLGWVSMTSMLVALGAVVVAFRYRGQIVEVGQKVAKKIGETIAGRTEVGAYLEVVGGDEMLMGKKIPLYSRTVTPVGRNPELVELIFHAGNEKSPIGRLHCEFCDDNGVFKIRDKDSRNGTFVNGERLQAGGDGQPLTDGDRIELGPAERGGVILIFRASGK